ncbi:MAG: biopolymer transporter ExbD [Desulfobulbaceae bacterium]|jgi:biopolymer transport protein ExbD|nr:biopolymer transporter ExbD [Desulfobulbaceae bacterium]MDH3782269.1 biopolymer transporter ExbD [Desulfobulbaceae bacterium]MDH3866561.1 biopolymer transporter ExbD [Desulfobulbaceae bacterium]HKJ13643.1 biopolymer transporter ExbD [Desulfobulbales bacterium]
MKVPSSRLGIKKTRIEMLPLIDVVFLLLVFFIYAMLSMAVHRSLPVSLPVSSATEIRTEVNLTITVNDNGEIFLDNTSVSQDELQTFLLKEKQKETDNKSVQVDLFADKALSYQELYRVLDIIRTAGISNVSLQADIPK